MPVIETKISVMRCEAEPMPADPKLIQPGLARAIDISSCTLVAGELTGTSRTNGAPETSDNGVRSRIGSYFTFDSSGLNTATLEVHSRIVWPSGRATVVSSAAIEPPAPDRLSTTTVCRRSSPIFCATMRATMSVVPPGTNGTTRRTGREG